ncbi:MAG: T9SS type A sorting domain-containing protein [Bacteroidales bacterium]|nr:T9SS type A sorting domain-containing protein [Bacteroidales bacterium]MCF8403539.1 T9SS type A sorting domain-containing protein [Bacteroidales bacterium]
MRIFFLFLLFPFALNAQEKDGWLTSFANIEFNENTIVFKYCGGSPVCSPIPMFKIKGVQYIVTSGDPISCKTISLEKRIIENYLCQQINLNDKNEALDYLKAISLQLIFSLSGDKSPNLDMRERVRHFIQFPDHEISSASLKVMKLYEEINYTLPDSGSLLHYIDGPIDKYNPPMFNNNTLITGEGESLKIDSTNWPKYYGEPNRYDYSRDIIETYDKAFLMSGGYFDDESGWSWLIKTDVNGDVLWEKIIESEESNYLNAVYQTSDGGILACGAVWTDIGASDPFVIKLNACGDKEWCTIFAGSIQTNPWAQDIVETSSGNIIVLVNQYGENNVGDMDLFKLNSQGNLIWRKTYCSSIIHPESALPLGKKIMITSQNEYLISGDVYWEDPWNPGGPKGLRSLFVKVDSTGNEKWVLPFGLNDTIFGQGKNIFQINDNRFIGIANKWPTETMQTLLLEFDSLGNTIQYVIIDNELISPSIQKGVPLYFEHIDSYYVLGGLYVIPNEGYATEILLDTNIFNNITVYDHIQHNSEDPYTMITAFNKKIVSNSTLKQTGNWEIALSKLNLNLEYDTLDPGNYTYDSLCTTPGLPQSGFIYLDDCDIITGVDIPIPEEYYAHLKTIPITAYPNPATKGGITFEFENTEHHSNIELKCFDIYGKEIYTEIVFRHQEKSIVDINIWPGGMYVAVIYSDGLPVGNCKFVVH